MSEERLSARKRIEKRRKKIASSLKTASDKSLKEKIQSALQSDEIHLWSREWAPLILGQVSDDYVLYQAQAACDVLSTRYSREYVGSYIKRNMNGNHLEVEETMYPL